MFDFLIFLEGDGDVGVLLFSVLIQGFAVLIYQLVCACKFRCILSHLSGVGKSFFNEMYMCLGGIQLRYLLLAFTPWKHLGANFVGIYSETA